MFPVLAVVDLYMVKNHLIQSKRSNYLTFFFVFFSLIQVIKSLSAPAGTPQEIQKTLQDNKATFFFRIERELEKVNSFYLQKEAELKLRLEILCEKKTTAYNAGSLFSKASLSSITLHEGFQRFLRDLDKLEQFIELNATAFSKVLKKWDKRSKSQTKELYLSRAVEVQPVFHREELAEMSDLASSSILELEAWSDGESVIFEGKGSSTNTSNDLAQNESLDTSLSDTPQSTDQDDQMRNFQQYPKGSSFNYNKKRLSSITSDSRATDELYHEFIKTASSTDNENTPQVLADWIYRLSQLEGAKEKMTRIFLLAIPTKASEAALLALYNSGNIDINAHDEITNQTVLHKACISGRTAIVDFALKKHVEPTIQDTYGRTALHYACIHNHPNLIPKFVNNDKSVLDSLDKDNFSPLLCSIITKHTECVRLLIDLGAKVDASDAEKFYIPLNFACQYGVYDAAKMLLECSQEKQPAMKPDAEGLYPIHIAARAGHTKLIRLLTSYNVNVNEVDKLNKWTAIFYAASEGHSQTVQELINANALIDVLDEEGHSPLYYATWEGHVRCMEHLSKALIKAQLLKDKEKSVSLANSTSDNIDSISSPLDHSRAINISNGTFDSMHNSGSIQNDNAFISSSILSPKDDVMIDIEDGDIDGIPDLSLPPPILPFRKYGHNFLDKKIFVQLIFDATPFSSSSSFRPAIDESLMDRDINSSSVLSSPQSLCSNPLSDADVDPPSVPGKKPIEFDKGNNSLPAGRLTIASRGDHNIIPQNIILPFSDTDRVVSFQVDSLENFAIDFEIYPTYGTRIVAKTAALSYVFNNPSGYNFLQNGNKDQFPETLGAKNYCTLPLFDMRLHTVGKLNFAFQIVKPFSGEPLEITKFDTYWKSTSQVEQQAPSQNITPANGSHFVSSSVKPHDSTQSQVQLLLQSQRSDSPVISNALNGIVSGFPSSAGTQNSSVSTTAMSSSIPIPVTASNSSNFGPSSITSSHQFPASFSSHHLSSSHHNSLHPLNASVSSQSLSFVTASSLSGSFARIRVCLTKDKVPVVAPFWTISVAGGIEIPIGNLNLDQVLSLAASGLSMSTEQYQADCKHRVKSANTFETIYSAVSTRYMHLQEFLSSSPVDLKLDICVLYPTLAESLYTNLGLSSFSDLNEYVDSILTVLFDHVRSVRSARKHKKSSVGLDGKLYGGSTEDMPTRSVIFSSAHPDVCTVLNWKQPNYPVFFQVSGVDVNMSTLRKAANNELENAGDENTKQKQDEVKGGKPSSFRLVSAHGFPVTETDRRCTSLKDAASFASNNNLLGIICSANLLSLVPSLVATIRVFGLVLVSETGDSKISSVTEDQQGSSQQLVVQGVDGNRNEKVLNFKCAIDM